MSRRDVSTKEIPTILHDVSTGKRYQKGRFLGKGGFAKCYEITDLETKEIFAGKIVPKVNYCAYFKKKLKQRFPLKI